MRQAPGADPSMVRTWAARSSDGSLMSETNLSLMTALPTGGGTAARRLTLRRTVSDAGRTAPTDHPWTTRAQPAAADRWVPRRTGSDPSYRTGGTVGPYPSPTVVMT